MPFAYVAQIRTGNIHNPLNFFRQPFGSADVACLSFFTVLRRRQRINYVEYLAGSIPRSQKDPAGFIGVNGTRASKPACPIAQYPKTTVHSSSVRLIGTAGSTSITSR